MIEYNQITDIEKNVLFIEQLDKTIEDIKEMYGGFIDWCNNNDIQKNEDINQSYTEIMQNFTNKKQAFEKITKRLIEYIENIDDITIKTIILMRIHGEEWRNIAIAMNNTTEAVKKQFYRFIKKQSKKGISPPKKQ